MRNPKKERQNVRPVQDKFFRFRIIAEWNGWRSDYLRDKNADVSFLHGLTYRTGIIADCYSRIDMRAKNGVWWRSRSWSAIATASSCHCPFVIQMSVSALHTRRIKRSMRLGIEVNRPFDRSSAKIIPDNLHEGMTIPRDTAWGVCHWLITIYISGILYNIYVYRYICTTSYK